MTVSKARLREIIKEELESSMEEGIFDRLFGKKKEKPAEKPRREPLQPAYPDVTGKWFSNPIPNDKNYELDRNVIERMKEMILLQVGVIDGEYTYDDQSVTDRLDRLIDEGGKAWENEREFGDTDIPFNSTFGGYRYFVNIYNQVVREHERGIYPFQKKGSRLVPNDRDPRAWKRSRVYRDLRGSRSDEPPMWMDRRYGQVYQGGEYGRY